MFWTGIIALIVGIVLGVGGIILIGIAIMEQSR